MMREAHQAAAMPLGLGQAWAMAYWDLAPVPVAVGCVALVVLTSTWPDLDHPRFKTRMHPGAALVRGTAQLGYMIRTAKDVHREDLHRGPSHCLEWAVLAGAATVVAVLQVPPLAAWAWWAGVAVALGCASHVLTDWLTPSGVPISAVYNYFAHGEVWRRHSLNLLYTDGCGEHYLAVPALRGLTVVIALAMLGWLGPVVTALTGLGGS